jgi:hypothetical protein
VHPRTVHRLILVLSLSLGLVAWSVHAALAAATAPGFSVLWTSAPQTYPAVTCDDPCTSIAAINVYTDGSGVPANKSWRFLVLSADPGPAYGPGAAPFALADVPGTTFTSPPGNVASTYVVNWPSQPVAPGPFIEWIYCDSGTSSCHGYALGSTTVSGGSSPAPTTTTAPPSGGGTSTPAPTTSPGSTGTAPGTGSGTGTATMSCTVETPCVVTLADGQQINLDASGLTVQALTDDQWKEILLALGALTFFAAASFASRWRRGGRS